MKDVNSRARTKKLSEHDLKVKQHVWMMLQKLAVVLGNKNQEE